MAGLTDVGGEELYLLAERTGAALSERDWMLATAESCTGGWVGEAVTAVPGSSRWYDRGFITYTNTAKQEMLGVREVTLAAYGAVSEATVAEMAAGALVRSHAQVALAISGIAGPGGGSLEKPVGTVCFAWANSDGVRAETRHFVGDRKAIREQAVIHALNGVLRLVAGAKA